MKKEEIGQAVQGYIEPLSKMLEEYKEGKRPSLTTDAAATIGSSMSSMFIQGEIAYQLAELNEKIEMLLQHITKDGLPLRK